ncbi:hypothetical protein [Priestia endophytica]|uniref:hypothetical protein n=1 Tax=Priestia endophytica TaxID=135735 RepID=UPI00227FCC1E|nr:hypothetical protein [Priestia endophytica]MCY8232001.1 hypothetical protein [Priestia endophytica]
MKEIDLGERLSVRLNDKVRGQVRDLMNLYGKESIGKVTVADVVRYAIDNLHETKFPDREEDDEDDYDEEYD